MQSFYLFYYGEKWIAESFIIPFTCNAVLRIIIQKRTCLFEQVGLLKTNNIPDFLAVPWVCLQFVIVVFPDHNHSLYFEN